jgi:acyl carrier protein
MEEKVITMLEDVLEIKDIDITATSKNYPSWDSMGLLNIALEIEETWNVSLEPSEIASLTSVMAIISLLRSKGIE